MLDIDITVLLGDGSLARVLVGLGSEEMDVGREDDDGGSRKGTDSELLEEVTEEEEETGKERGSSTALDSNKLFSMLLFLKN
jgi:hypothetical protein